MQRKVWFHLAELVNGQIALAKGRHPEIDKGRLKWSLAQPAKSIHKFRTAQRRAISHSRAHQSYFKGEVSRRGARSEDVLPVSVRVAERPVARDYCDHYVKYFCFH